MQKQVKIIHCENGIIDYTQIIPVTRFSYAVSDGVFKLHEVTDDNRSSRLLWGVSINTPGWSVYLEDEQGNTVQYDGRLYGYIDSTKVTE